MGFAGAIGAVPIAEGAETPADLALLARTRGPLLVQGYALARPGPPWPAVTLPSASVTTHPRASRDVVEGRLLPQ